ncbi:MAG: trigger factor [Chloroflexi bacterium]|nr:MAG: trigger factor [Chloroflexota bacterium]TMG50219.1 MAG: trigger factor [Chloroflexota bacterium]
MAAVKVDTERKPGSQVVLSVEVDADQVSKSIDQAYSRLAPRVRIAGFRPGKAPRPMIEREIGWPALRQEALDLLLATAYNSALDEAGLDPIDVPRVEVQQFDRGQSMRFTATVSVKPEITLKEYKDIRVPRPRTEIGDVDVDEALERLRGRFAELHAVERPVQVGDFLTVDTHILKSGAVLIGESQTDAQLEVDRERLIPGLADGLIGQAIGESRDIRLALPADYPKKDLAGSDVVFRVTVKSVKERRLPALDDELARQVGRGETLAELRQEVHDELQEAAHQADEQRFENDVLKALDERMEAEIPEALIDREVNRRVRELELRLQEQGVKMERYLEYTNSSVDVMKAEQRPQAVQKVRLELALETVAEREGLTVSEAEIETAVANALAEDEQVSRRTRDLRTADPVRAYFRHQLLMRKTIDYLSTVASPESSDTMEPPAEAKELEHVGQSASGRERKTRGKKER